MSIKVLNNTVQYIIKSSEGKERGAERTNDEEIPLGKRSPGRLPYVTVVCVDGWVRVNRETQGRSCSFASWESPPPRHSTLKALDSPRLSCRFIFCLPQSASLYSAFRFPTMEWSVYVSPHMYYEARMLSFSITSVLSAHIGPQEMFQEWIYTSLTLPWCLILAHNPFILMKN